MNPEISILANGLTVVTDPMPGLESAALGVWVNTGSRNETPSEMGVSHMLEHMAFKGTARRTAKSLAEEIEAVGGILNAYTSREQTAFHARVLKADVPLALDILSDILINPVFATDEIERERQVVLQEIGQARDTPDDIIFDHLQTAIYAGQPLGWPILGEEKTVTAFNRKMLQGYMATQYRAGGMTLVASGAVTHQQIVALAEEKFGALATGAAAPVSPSHYVGGDARFVEDLEQAHLAFAFPGLSNADPDYYVGQLYAAALGGGMSSRLFQEAREKRGLCYSIYAFANGFQDSGFLSVYAGTGEAEAAEIAAVIAGEMAAMAQNLGEAELSRARAQLKASLLMGLERAGTRAEQIAGQLFALGRIQSPAEIVAHLDAIDAGQVKRYAARVMEAGAPTMAAVGPVGKLESHASFARRFGAGALPPRGRIVKTPLIKQGPIAFMRGLTFPGGQQPVIEGASIYLRYPSIGDYAEWSRLRGESREFLIPWEPIWASDELTRGAFRRRIKRYQKETRLDSAYVFFVRRRSDDALVGGCTLSNVRRGVIQCATLGYWIGERFARQGYMSEALGTLVPFVFRTLGLHRIEAACLTANDASRALLLRCGFREEGLAQRYLMINGAWRDHLLFALLSDEARLG